MTIPLLKDNYYYPGVVGICILPYPFATLLPIKSGPERRTTNYGQPNKLVVLKLHSNGKFQTIFLECKLWEVES
jgi:hypothetical protein